MGFNISSYVVFIDRVDWSTDPLLSEKLGPLNLDMIQKFVDMYKEFMKTHMSPTEYKEIVDDRETRDWSELHLKYSKVTSNTYAIFWIYATTNPGKFIHNLFKCQTQIIIDNDEDADCGPAGQFGFSDSLMDDNGTVFIHPDLMRPYLRKEIALTYEDIHKIYRPVNELLVDWFDSYFNKIPEQHISRMEQYLENRN